MQTCCHKECTKTATKGIKVSMRAPRGPYPDTVAPGYLQMPTCEEHKLPPSDVQQILDDNWEDFMVGFDRAGCNRPKKSRTTWDYCSWYEVEAFLQAMHITPSLPGQPN